VDVRDTEGNALFERLLDELRALREQTAAQNELLSAILARLGEIERTQIG
jgi:hypothetical protein